MLDELRQWTMNLAGIMVFGSLCHVMLPEGSFQKYIRLTLGLVLVLTLLTPLQSILSWEPFGNEGKETQIRAYLRREEMEAQQKKDVMRLYGKNLEEKMLSSLQRRCGNIEGEIHCTLEERTEQFGSVKGVLVLIRGGTVEAETVKEILYTEYGIPKGQVRIQYVKEQEE